jgi:uncharacterized membrane protein YozB (DUF420 family)
MSRRIVTTSFQSIEGPKTSVDTYFDKVIKYIPADIVGAWIAVTGLISSDGGAPKTLLLWIAFAVGTVLTILWTLKQTSALKKKPAITQALISTGSFVVWVFALGGPFSTLGFYRPLYGSLLLIFYTLSIGLVTPPEN